MSLGIVRGGIGNFGCPPILGIGGGDNSNNEVCREGLHQLTAVIAFGARQVQEEDTETAWKGALWRPAESEVLKAKEWERYGGGGVEIFWCKVGR